MDNLVSLSVVAVYSAMGVYTVAFLLFTLDLAKRSTEVPQRTQAPVGASVGASAPAEALEQTELSRTELPRADSEGLGGATRFQRAAFALTILGWVLHFAAIN